MATATYKQERRYTLELTDYEARYIKEFCQNALNNEESSVERALRQSIYTALTKAVEIPALEELS